MEDIELLPPRVVSLKGMAKEVVLSRGTQAKLQYWMKHGLPGALEFHLKYENYSKKLKKKKKAVVEFASFTAPTWYGRRLSREEAARVDAPYRVDTFKRCSIGREEYRIEAVD